MKHFILLLVLFSLPAYGALFGPAEQDLVTTQLLENGGFENGEDRWTPAGSSVLDTVTSGVNLGVGASTGSWDATAAAETLESTAIPIPEGLKNRICLA